MNHLPSIPRVHFPNTAEKTKGADAARARKSPEKNGEKRCEISRSSPPPFPRPLTPLSSRAQHASMLGSANLARQGERASISERRTGGLDLLLALLFHPRAPAALRSKHGPKRYVLLELKTINFIFLFLKNRIHVGCVSGRKNGKGKKDQKKTTAAQRGSRDLRARSAGASRLGDSLIFLRPHRTQDSAAAGAE